MQKHRAILEFKYYDKKWANVFIPVIFCVKKNMKTTLLADAFAAYGNSVTPVTAQ